MVRGVVFDDERVFLFIGRVFNSNKSEIFERANDRIRRGKI